MDREERYVSGNRILDDLPPADRSEVTSQLAVFHHSDTSLVWLRDAPIDAVYFPVDAVYSIVVELARGTAYEVATVGRSDVLGAELLIGAEVAARTALCQVGGRVARMELRDFRACLVQSRPFVLATQESLRRQWFVSQQTVACNFVHTDVQRCARWILMTQDQTNRDCFPLRAEYFSIMLGLATAQVERPMRELESLGGISYLDEVLTIFSRERLRQSACECYMMQQITPFIRAPGSAETAVEHARADEAT
jgi:CRP-like cAMP-binding protein